MAAACIFLLHFVDKDGSEVQVYTAQFKSVKDLKQGFSSKYPDCKIITFKNVTYRFFPR